MELQGRIKYKGETQAFGANGFRKREMVITTDEQFPQHILVEFTQDKCDLIESYQVGEAVKVQINLRGREWVNPQGETKYFNTIQAWKIDRVQNYQAPPPAQGYTGQGSAVDAYQNNQQTNTNPQQVPAQGDTNYREEEHDDLPF